MASEDLPALADLLPPRPRWHRWAACREYPDVTWFPTRGESADPAKAICATCPVLEACREWALEQDELAGIWAGTNTADRQEMR